MKPPPGPDEFDWAAHTEAVAADIFGEPNEEMSRPTMFASATMAQFPSISRPDNGTTSKTSAAAGSKS